MKESCEDLFNDCRLRLVGTRVREFRAEIEGTTAPSLPTPLGQQRHSPCSAGLPEPSVTERS